MSPWYLPPPIVFGVWLLVGLVGIPVGFGAEWLVAQGDKYGRYNGLVFGTTTVGWVVGWCVILITRTVRQGRRRLKDATARLLSEFPAEANDWGGELAFRDAKVVESLLVQVSQASFQVSSPPT